LLEKIQCQLREQQEFDDYVKLHLQQSDITKPRKTQQEKVYVK